MISNNVKNTARAPHGPAELPADDVDRIVGALRGLRYGAVTVIVQDGVIVQVERTEKLRVARGGGASA